MNRFQTNLVLSTHLWSVHATIHTCELSHTRVICTCELPLLVSARERLQLTLSKSQSNNHSFIHPYTPSLHVPLSRCFGHGPMTCIVSASNDSSHCFERTNIPRIALSGKMRPHIVLSGETTPRIVSRRQGNPRHSLPAPQLFRHCLPRPCHVSCIMSHVLACLSGMV